MAANKPYYVDALLYDGEPRWNAVSPVGMPVQITYSFMNALPTYYNADSQGQWQNALGEADNFQSLSAPQQEAVKLALQEWEKFSGIKFVQVEDGDQAQIRFGTTDISVNKDDDFNNDILGWASPPGENQGGDVWLAQFLETDESINQDLAPGTDGFQTLLHEIGHALGLKHPIGSLKGAEGTLMYTIMGSGDDGQDRHPDMYDVEPTTLSLYDVAAIQYLYGSNTATGTGDDLYQWDTNQQFLQTIWDVGGTDTISASNQTLDSVIDLRPGGFSSIGAYYSGGNDTSRARNNISVAYGSTIEHASGGAGNDTIFGNDVANLLLGNGGNDSLDGGAGKDNLNGNAGDDRMAGGTEDDFYSVDSAADKIIEYTNEGRDLVSATSSYTLSDNVEDLILTGEGVVNGTGNSLDNIIVGTIAANYLYGGDGNDNLGGQSGNDFLYGQSGNDFLGGDAGNDWLVGEIGDDLIVGNAGNDRLFGDLGKDWLRGGEGRDSLRGGADADRFVFDSLRQGVDRIVDFQTNQDDRILVSAKGLGSKLDTGRLDRDQYTLGSRATSEDAQFIYNARNGNLFFDVDGIGGRRQILFVALTPKSVLSRADIAVIA